MATLPITIPDAVVPRVRTAFGHQGPPENPVWIDATNAEVQADLEDYINRRTRAYEEAVAMQAAVGGVTDVMP